MNGNSQEEAALLTLLRSRRTSAAVIRAQIVEGRLPSELLEEDQAEHLVRVEEDVDAHSILESWRKQGMFVLTPFSPDYPAQLLEVHDHPLFLFGYGRLVDDQRSIAIVGSREPTPDSLELASNTAQLLANQGITVISGMARGIDAAAHIGAIRGGGRTVAILGTGAEIAYPREHTDLHRSIVETGLVLSQFWPHSTPSRISFPMRNVTMSGYAGATLIIAAGEKSGTRHQAQAAVRHGRMLILTERVASQTSWGREYVDRDMALVASTVDEITQAAHLCLRDRGALLAEAMAF